MSWSENRYDRRVSVCFTQKEFAQLEAFIAEESKTRPSWQGPLARSDAVRLLVREALGIKDLDLQGLSDEEFRRRATTRLRARAAHPVAQPCEKCGQPAERHHDDYGKPTEIRWLCRPCHTAAHTRVASDARPCVGRAIDAASDASAPNPCDGACTVPGQLCRECGK
jgi:hypothetical protein